MSEKKVSQRVRDILIEQAGGRCEYCQSSMRYCPDPFSVEHIYPKILGGTNVMENLAVSCQGCNGYKGKKISVVDPLTGETVPLFHPRQQAWRDHFVWSADFTQVIGRTATGRATVEKLQLNREGVVNLRTVLLIMGEHPPQSTLEVEEN
jgi:hypothetical protein